MKDLGPTTDFSLMLFGLIARSGHIKCAGDGTQLVNKIMQTANDQGFVITRKEKVNGSTK